MDAKIQDDLHVVRRKQVQQIVGLSRSSVYGKLDPNSPQYDPTFPTQIALSGRAVGWLAHEVQAWLLAQVERRAEIAGRRKGARAGTEDASC